MDNWDPLDLQGSKTSEIVAAARKREIRNILKSYVGFFDPFCELIQNALDAVDSREKIFPDQNYKKKIWITVDLKLNQISVSDNGLGFTFDQFRLFLSPSISFKNSKDTRGNKGVGATYLAYGFNFLQMGTKTPDFQTIAEIRNGRMWVDDEEASMARPVVEESTLIHSAFSEVDRGSTFTLGFSGNVRPKDLGWFSASDAEQWKTLLSVRTPLGQILANASDMKTLFDLVVIDKVGSVSSVLNQQCLYIFPHTVIKATGKVNDILDEQQKLIKEKKDPSKLPAKFKKLNAVYDYWDSEQLKSLSVTDDEKGLINQYKIWAYGFFCYSAPKVLDKFSDETARLRRGLRILRGGVTAQYKCDAAR
jgi:hypothetical protein